MEYGDPEFEFARWVTRETFKRSGRSQGVSMPARGALAVEVEHVEWPQPIVPAVAVTATEAPKAVRLFAKRAVAAGWAVRVTFAMGTLSLATARERPDLDPTPTGRVAHTMDGPPHIALSYAVRCRRDQDRVTAIWVDGKYVHGLAIIDGVYDCTATGKREVEACLSSTNT